MSEHRRAFDDHEAFRSDGDGFAATTATFEARVDFDPRPTVRVELPTLDAVVVGETVADVVVDGWFDTFRRRVDDAPGVLQDAAVEWSDVSRHDGTVAYEARLAPDGGDPATAALALVNFVEGTWVQGIVPGYEYEERVTELRQRAMQRGTGGGAATGDRS